MSRRWSAGDLAEYDSHRRSAAGYVDFAPSAKPRRAKHESPYLHHAAAYCRSAGIAEPEGEYYFDPQREWRLDLVWSPDRAKLAIEVDGGLYVQGAHARGAGIERDHEKRNAALLQGWRVFVTTPRNIAETILMVKQLLER